MSDNETALKDQLIEFANNGGDWERMETPISGVFVVRPPPKKGKVTLMITIIPVDEEINPKSKRGIFISSLLSFKSLKKAFEDPKTMKLVEQIDKIFGEEKKFKNKKLEL